LGQMLWFVVGQGDDDVDDDIGIWEVAGTVTKLSGFLHGSLLSSVKTKFDMPGLWTITIICLWLDPPLDNEVGWSITTFAPKGFVRQVSCLNDHESQWFLNKRKRQSLSKVETKGGCWKWIDKSYHSNVPFLIIKILKLLFIHFLHIETHFYQ
jgi:hypothetical protein